MEEKKKFNSVEDYFNAQSEKVKDALLLIKQCILTVVPEANELLNYNIPAYALIKGGKREEQIMIAVIRITSDYILTQQQWRNSKKNQKATKEAKVQFNFH